jgi:L-malate glycosyltransferase
MRVLLLSNPDAAHTLKWVEALTARRVEVLLMGLQPPQRIAYGAIDRLRVASAGVPVWTTNLEGGLAKALYLRAVLRVRQLVREFEPDLVHAHYLTSYGLVGALASVHPYLVSVWGSDIYGNPDRSTLHRTLAKFALRRADGISATSRVMALRTRAFTDKPVTVVPFGIDLELFRPQAVERPFERSDLVIGTVKTLHETYGIRFLLEAFGELRRRHQGAPLKLLIVGGGPQERELKALSVSLGVDAHTVFTGMVAATEIPRYQNMIDVFVALSNSESFGVSVIEAGACERPVVVSDVGGLPEVVVDGGTGFVVPRGDSLAAADAIERLAFDAMLRRRMGVAARTRVAELYDLEHNTDQMLQLYGRVTRSGDTWVGRTE